MKTPTERFFKQLSCISGCWEWLGAKDKKGYGRFKIGKKSIYPHRFSFELQNGPIPEGLEIDHPTHLEAVYHHENILRGTHKNKKVKGIWKKSHCPQGHSYSEYGKPARREGNGRICIICERDRSKKYYKNYILKNGHRRPSQD